MTEGNAENGSTATLPWWRPVWICLAGEQPLPNVLPILPHLPEKVIFLHTNLEASKAAANRCAHLLSQRGVAVMTQETSAFEPVRVAEDVVTLAAHHDLGKVLLNYTGGTKVMSLAAHNALPPHIPKIYFDSRKGLMVNQEAFRQIESPLLTVTELLSLHADVEPELFAGAAPLGEASAQLIDQALLLDRRIANWLMAYRDKTLRALHQGRGWQTLTGAVPVPFQDKNAALALELEGAMRTDGLLLPQPGFCPTAGGLSFLEGFWWEQVVALRIRQGFAELGVPAGAMDLQTNLTVRWKAARTVTHNEFDLAFVFRNRLFLVSCTTASEAETEKRRVQAEAFIERLGGHFGKAMVASTLNAQSLDKLRARASDRLELPAISAWSNSSELVKRWCMGGS